MTISIIETLRNAEYNLQRGQHGDGLKTVVGINQLHTALVLLEKGYDPYDDVPDEVLSGQIKVDDVPDKD